MMRINPEGRTLSGLTTFGQFVALNLIYLVTCLPIITVGAATSSLFEVTMRYADEERGYLIKDYFLTFKDNWWRASLVMIIFAVPMMILIFVGLFWYHLDTFGAAIAAVVSFLLACYCLSAALYGWAQVARYHNNISQIIKNAMLLPMVEPLRTLIILVIPVVVTGLTQVIPGWTWVLVAFGFSLGAYACAFMFLATFRRHDADVTQ